MKKRTPESKKRKKNGNTSTYPTETENEPKKNQAEKRGGRCYCWDTRKKKNAREGNSGILPKDVDFGHLGTRQPEADQPRLRKKATNSKTKKRKKKKQVRKKRERSPF